MMIRFRVEGPLVVRPLQGIHGRMIEKSAIERFWEENPDLADEVGCYIFGMRSGGGLTPIYVGQSTTGFKHECFQHHKLTHYNEALVTRNGTPIMFFVVKDAGPQSILETCLDQVEHYLIQLAVQHNPDLANVKRVEWSIPGVFHAEPGHPTASAMALRQILGIVHPIQPAVQKTPDEEKANAALKEQTATASSTAEPGDAPITEDDNGQRKGIKGSFKTNEVE
ncbi:MAG TPA: hypothetical protein VH643_39805 [Gemmataceae bacterium]